MNDNGTSGALIGWVNKAWQIPLGSGALFTNTAPLQDAPRFIPGWPPAGSFSRKLTTLHHQALLLPALPQGGGPSGNCSTGPWGFVRAEGSHSGLLQFTYGLTVPFVLPRRSINLTWGFQAQFNLPTSLSNFYPTTVDVRSNSFWFDLPRLKFYQYLSTLLDK